MLVIQSCPTLLRPHGLQPTRLLCLWDYPGKDTGLVCHFLLQGEGRGSSIYFFFFFPSSERPVKWALGSITTNKASGGDRIPVELFQILKDDAVKVLHSICLQTWKTKQWSLDWKGQFSFQSLRKAMPKNAQTTSQLHSFHTLVR